MPDAGRHDGASRPVSVTPSRGTNGPVRRNRWDHAGDYDQTVLLATADGPRRRALHDRIVRVAGRDRARTLGRYPRFRVIVAGTGAVARRRSASATIAAVDLSLPGGPGLDTIRALR